MAATEEASSYPSPTKQGTNLTSLVSLSTQVYMALNPLQSGNSVMKSMDHVWNLPGGVGMGYSSSEGG